MKTHFSRVIKVALAVVIAAVPAILADPSFAHYVATHPWAATYLPLVSGVVLAVYRAAKDKAGTSGAGKTSG